MIRHLTISNFKCFQDAAIPFAKLTVLTGLNGSGKSSAVQPLLLLRQSFQQGILQTLGLALNGILVRIGTGRDALSAGTATEEVSFAMEWAADVQGTWTFGYNADSDLLPLRAATHTGEIYTQLPFAGHFQYLQAERLGPRVSLPASEYSVRQSRDLGVAGEYVAHYLSEFGETDDVLPGLRHPNADRTAHLRRQTEAWLNELSPGVRVTASHYTNMDSVRLQFHYVGATDVTPPFRATNVGFGISYALPVVVAILSAQVGGLIILENPEAHLHPRGQARLGHLLALAANAGVQVVVETHSDHVLNGIRVAARRGEVAPENICIHFFTHSDEDVVSPVQIISPELDSGGRLSDWPPGFFDEWDHALDALLE